MENYRDYSLMLGSWRTAQLAGFFGVVISLMISLVRGKMSNPKLNTDLSQEEEVLGEKYLN